MKYLLSTLLKFCSILTLSVIVFGCDSGDPEIIPEPREPRLKSMENSGANYTYEYYYGENNELVEVMSGSVKRYEIEYNEGRAIIYKHYTSNANGSTMTIDSLGYDENGQVTKIFDVSSYYTIPRFLMYEYAYDETGRPIEKKSHTKGTDCLDEYHGCTKVNKYYWVGNNMIKWEWRGPSGGILQEEFFTYDDKTNFLKDVPYHLKARWHWGENNIIIYEPKNFHPLIDTGPLQAWPVSYEYEGDYPISRVASWEPGKAIMTWE